jgi:site-specific DNA-methyltransferase (adenine-specific)
MKDFELYKGDCNSFLKQLENESIDLILTDPPFGQNIGYGRSELGHRYIENDNNLDWIKQFSETTYRILKQNSHCVVFWQWRTYSKLEEVMLQAGFTIKTVGIWDKNNSGLGDGLAEQYEQVIVFKKGNAKQNKFRGNIFRYSRISGRPEHPHQKPIPLLADLLMLCSQEEGLVLDPFMGSGSTGVAAMKYKRCFIGCEIDNDYYKLAEKRIKNEASKLQLF